ncbi:aldehyde dehydrogenase [Leclercia sp. W17]|nr:aldehyde dehydrogenase [Leclercia sp. W17]
MNFGEHNLRSITIHQGFIRFVNFIVFINIIELLTVGFIGNDSNLLIVFYVQIMPDDLVMQLHRF